MAAVTKDEMRQQIKVTLKDVELSTTSAKKVRQQLEEHYGESLLTRKDEINELVKEYVNSREDSSDDYQSEEDGTDEDEENNKKKPVKRPAPPPANAKKNAKKSKGDSSSEEESDQEEESNESDDDSYPAKKPVPKKKAPPKKKGKGSDSDSDSDWGKGKGKKGGGGGAAAGGGAGRGKGGGGYTRALKLSPQLASLMGKESMARHEVVKKMWAIIKERNLYDPNNKQFAICDEDLMKVIGTKRFRTFGMMKYLKSHFRD